ncbi:hypothetical protein GCM10022251_54930 [Phytohabitans flavus]|nr:hypothetical protein [Phytohabitans flavus]
MDDTERGSVDERAEATIGRRAFFGRAFMATGAAVGLLTLTACPGGESDDDDDDDDD